MVRDPDELSLLAERSNCRVVFPGVGSFGAAMEYLGSSGFRAPLEAYLKSCLGDGKNNKYLGVCLGLQTLFEGSEESPGVRGLGIIPGIVGRFESDLVVPHIGWNGVRSCGNGMRISPSDRVYFVHSFRVVPTEENKSWALGLTEYGGKDFVCAVGKGGIAATQFHPEKSGDVGIGLFRQFLGLGEEATSVRSSGKVSGLSKRIVACLDVRSNDQGDLVVTKGESYDVREKEGGSVRNLGKPVELAARYYEEGADEIVFLNITAFRDVPLEDSPLLRLLEAASEKIFVPLTIGGGIRDYVDSSGKKYSALQVAARYFRAGADKVSIGSDAVYAAEQYYSSLKNESPDDKNGSSISQISHVYGRQAVVVSVDPRRVYFESKFDAMSAKTKGKTVLRGSDDRYYWYQCTVKGGREGRDIDAVQLAVAVQALGAGELLVNCIDNDGQGKGFDIDLLRAISSAVTIPVIASSGAGCVEHFSQVFEATRVEAALAAGIFHRREVPIRSVKDHLEASAISVRPFSRVSVQELLQRAVDARKNAYCPYSNYPVTAALLARDGTVFIGTNVENAAFSCTCCAERSAVFAAVSNGYRKFDTLCVVTRDGGSPCGPCRQVLVEIAPSMKVVVGKCSDDSNEASVVLETTPEKLLPSSFRSFES